jgi:DNA-binding ferritin-like protein
MNFITNLLTLQNQMRVFHWQTQHKVGSFAQHTAFGTAYEELDEKIDDFIEVYQGKNGVIMASGGTFNLALHNLSDNAEEFVDEYVSYLVEYVPQSLEEADTDLLNIRDEMLAILNQTKYRLKLK